MFTKTLIGISMLFCIGCLGAGTHDASRAEIRKNTEKFIKYFNFSLDQERVEPFKITPVQILQSPLFEKFELAGYSCEINKMNGIVSEVSVFKQNERIADIQVMTANSSRDSIIILGNWLTDCSMQTDFLLSLYGMERNKIGEIYFYFKKFYDKHVNRYSKKNCTTFFVRHGIIVLLRNTTVACPVGEFAKAIDDKILKALADAEKKSRERNETRSKHVT